MLSKNGCQEDATMKVTTFARFAGQSFWYSHSYTADFSKAITTHTHIFCELLFVTKGNVVYSVEGKSYPISKNSLIISRAMEAHAIIPQKATEYERYDIILDESRCGAKIYQMIPQNVDVINLNGNELVCGLFKKMDYYYNSSEGDILQTLLENLTEEILYNVAQLAQKEKLNNICTANPVIMQAIEYINENITDPLPIETICQRLHISKSHLHRLFLTHLNTTPKKYITVKKLRMAQVEMQAGSTPTEVAARYGFGNYSTFYRSYKQFFQVIPSERMDTVVDEQYY